MLWVVSTAMLARFHLLKCHLGMARCAGSFCLQHCVMHVSSKNNVYTVIPVQPCKKRKRILTSNELWNIWDLVVSVLCVCFFCRWLNFFPNMSNVFVSLLLKTHNSITEYSKCDTTGFNVQFFFSLAWLPRVKFDWLKLVEGDSQSFFLFFYLQEIFSCSHGGTRR